MSSSVDSSQNLVLLFDFDGTVSQGDGPVIEYATALANATGMSAVLTETTATLEQAEVQSDYPDTAAPRDGYALVKSIATQLHIPEPVCQSAYLASRSTLSSTGIKPVPGLANFLQETRAQKILATNSPVTGIAAALDVLKLGDAFDRVINNLGKPQGLEDLLNGDLAGKDIISIGDIWEFDLAPVAKHGGRTILIKNRFIQTPDCQPTWTVSHPAELVPLLRTITEAPS
ncbi:hypothetical protein WG936_10260 [Corynebacterium sp. H127]|uniref:HAD family hydrolase n=1 Tax=Corynebacterium sp. H127 TaxID=3133418 RepID=UPI0030A9D776